MSSLTLPKDHPYSDGRTCTTCGQFKPASEYQLEKDSRSFGGVSMRSKCRPCNEFRKYKAFIKRAYGISYEAYEELLEKQNGGCAICGSKGNQNKRTYGNLFVDHCHTTGEVRGLLCSKCNHAIGLLDDDIEKLCNAIVYLGKE